MTKAVANATPTITVTLRHSNNHSSIETYARDAVMDLVELFPDIISCHVIFDHQKNDHEKNKLAEVTVHIPHHDFVAKDAGPSYEQSLTDCLGAIQRQIRKHKEKLH